MSQGGVFLLIAAILAHSQQAKIEKVKAEQAERTCLAQALYYEARGEGRRGQEAVAEVVLHRVRSGTHPHSICGVVYEPHQFSFVGDGSMLRKLEPDAWKQANTLADRIMRGEIVTVMTRRALYYHEISVQPKWASALVRTVQIGNHVFYKP